MGTTNKNVNLGLTGKIIEYVNFRLKALRFEMPDEKEPKVDDSAVKQKKKKNRSGYFHLHPTKGFGPPYERRGKRSNG